VIASSWNHDARASAIHHAAGVTNVILDFWDRMAEVSNCEQE
jgi:hypothetical protein